MGEIIPFPLARRRPHVALSWDHAWDSYRVAMRTGCAGPMPLVQWFAVYSEAHNVAHAVAAENGLPLIDCIVPRFAGLEADLRRSR